jgi:CDP-4-dehydro-6-deoxyglucose reductase
MPNVVLNNDLTYKANEGESLLSAAARAGISMAYSCKTGRCSTCKCKITAGESKPLSHELGLSEKDKADGWILSCVRAAVSDLQIDVPDLLTVPLPALVTVPCRIQATRLLTPDVMCITLRLPPNIQFDYIPGQYIDIVSNTGVKRSYSLANAKSADKFLELHIKRVENGMLSEYWFNQAKVNDLLRLIGPSGTFFLRDVAGQDVIFLATGTGIAPVKAMLETMVSSAPESRPKSISVYWGGRQPEDLYISLPSTDVPMDYVPVLSRADDNWSGARGYVQNALLNKGFDPLNTVVYACGSDAMISTARAMLVDAGLPERRFLSDAFVCSAPNKIN